MPRRRAAHTPSGRISATRISGHAVLQVMTQTVRIPFIVGGETRGDERRAASLSSKRTHPQAREATALSVASRVSRWRSRSVVRVVPLDAALHLGLGLVDELDGAHAM